MPDRNDEASRLARLVADIDEIDRSRLCLLDRIEELKGKLQSAGDRTMVMRASVELLCDHVTDLATTASEFSLFEREVHESQQALDDANGEARALAFESESLQEALTESEEDLERLNSFLIDRRVKSSRGH